MCLQHGFLESATFDISEMEVAMKTCYGTCRCALTGIQQQAWWQRFAQQRINRLTLGTFSYFETEILRTDSSEEATRV